MTPTEVAAAIASAGFFLSMLGTAVGVGIAYATLKAQVAALQKSQADFATKADVQLVAIQVAEIKGMFRLTPVEQSGARQPD